MRKMDLTLWALARCPFLSADDLALLAGTGTRAARAHLARLGRAGLVDGIHPPGTRLSLYSLAPAGIVAAARTAGTSPATLAARYGLGDRALQRRLPALERLVAGRRVLLALHQELAARGGRLEEWRAWPVPWPYRRGSRCRVLSLDGEGMMRLPACWEERRPFGLLWDGDGAVPPMALAARLAALEMLAAAPAYGGPRSPRVPPILLVTASAERVSHGYRPGLLWTTWADVMTKGVIDAPWRSSDLGDEALPLPAALAAQGVGPTWTPFGVPLSHGETPVMPRTRGQRQRLQERIDALHDGGTQDGDLSLLALAIPPRGMAILETVGGHPLLPATDIARVCDLNPVDARDLLDRLCQYGLAAAWTPPGKRRTRRYVLMARGLRLLAARVGLAPDAYRHIYAALDETAGGARRGLRFAQRNLAHTDGINSVYLALLAAVRAAGGALQWRGEWACTQIYANGPRLHTLRPDAEGRYCGPVGPLHFFVEVDRGHPLSGALAELRRAATFLRVPLRGLTVDEVQRMMSIVRGQG